MTDHLKTFNMWIHLLSPFTIPSTQWSHGAMAPSLEDCGVVETLQTSMKGVMVDNLHYHRY